jgi:hypothetical protein
MVAEHGGPESVGFGVGALSLEQGLRPRIETRVGY